MISVSATTANRICNLHLALLMFWNQVIILSRKARCTLLLDCDSPQLVVNLVTRISERLSEAEFDKGTL